MDNQPTQPEEPVSQAPPAPAIHSDTFQTMLPTKNVPSLLSYYFGVFGLIPLLGLPLSVAAVILGVIALNRYKQNPTPGAKGHAITGIVLGALELTVFVAFIIFVIVAN